MNIVKLSGFQNIYAADSFNDDYRKLFGKSKFEHRVYLKKLMDNLGILDTEAPKGVSVFTSYDQFEVVQNTPFCSIRHVSKLNPRVVFAYISEEGKVILLSCFKEKKKEDYNPAIHRAHNIIKLLGVTLDEQ